MFANLTPWGSLQLEHQNHPVADVAHEPLSPFSPIKSSICTIDSDSLLGEINGRGKPILTTNRWTFSDSLCVSVNKHKCLQHSAAQTNALFTPSH